MAGSSSFSFTSCMDDPMTRQLHGLLVSNLHSIFQSALEKLTAHGYGEDAAVAAMSRGSLYRPGTDVVSNLVDDALVFLQKKQSVDEDHIFGDLEKIAGYMVLEMVNVLIEVKPSFTASEAMWLLIVSDMDVSLACTAAKPGRSSPEDWTRWAHDKIMHVARILIRDRDKLATLRTEEEKEEKDPIATRLRITKRLADMEAALGDAKGVQARTEESIRTLQVKNPLQRDELEKARLEAEEARARYSTMREREHETLMKGLALERLKERLEQGAQGEKKKTSRLQESLTKSQHRHSEIEARLRQEEAETEALRAQLASIRREREAIQEMEREEEERTRRETHRAMEQYAQEKEKLERKLARLKLASESSKIEALKHGTRASCSTSSSHVDPNEARLRLRQERECVMCLSEEREIVFLPCAHQVLCSNCNQLHVEYMTECPSCRTPIQQRIHAHFGRS